MCWNYRAWLYKLSVEKVPTATIYRELGTRNAKCKIKSLKRTDSSTTEDVEEMAVFTNEFYSKLYSVHEIQPSKKAGPTTRKLTKRRRAELKEQITLKEFQETVKSMHNNKTPGLDRLGVELYKNVSILVNTLWTVYNEVGKISDMMRGG